MAVVSTAIRTMLVNDIPRFLVNQYMYILYHSCMLYSHHLLGLPRMFVVSIIPNITDLINLSSCIRRPKKFIFRSIIRSLKIIPRSFLFMIQRWTIMYFRTERLVRTFPVRVQRRKLFDQGSNINVWGICSCDRKTVFTIVQCSARVPLASSDGGNSPRACSCLLGDFA